VKSLKEYYALSPSDQTGTVAGRNLKKRIDHLTPASTTLAPAWSGKEEYTVKVNEASCRTGCCEKGCGMRVISLRPCLAKP
jgi:hypothetical protein